MSGCDVSSDSTQASIDLNHTPSQGCLQYEQEQREWRWVSLSCGALDDRSVQPENVFLLHSERRLHRLNF